MKYEECREWLENRRLLKGSVPGLEQVRSLLACLDNPEKEMKIIHIAGTNGKGSVGYLLESIIALNKIKVGRFLSPAVIDEREIILVNGKTVPKTKWADGLTRIIETVEKNGLQATAFEIEYVLSLLIFKQYCCDLVILECGMGGLLDATNECPGELVDIITSISIDHCNFLGDTLEDISLHKFGIIKPTTKHVVIAPQKNEIYDYFETYCLIHRDLNNIQVTKSDINILKHKIIKGKDFVKLQIKYKNFDNLILSLPGEQQCENAAAVLDTVNILVKEGFDISLNSVTKAFENALWPGRFEIINCKRLYILDGAHNKDAVQRLMDNISLYFTNKKFVYIMGMYKDKEVDEVLSLCAGKAKAIVTVSARDRKRAVDAYDLGKECMKYNDNVTAADSYEEALEIAGYLADKNDIILIFGSLSFLGEMRERITDSERVKK